MKFFYFSSDNLLMNKFKLNKKLLLSVSLFFSLIFLFADSSYKVQKGDTLYSISKKFQITVQELRAANNLSEIPDCPPPRRHKLSGNLKDYWGIDYSKNYRFIIRPY